MMYSFEEMVDIVAACSTAKKVCKDALYGEGVQAYTALRKKTFELMKEHYPERYEEEYGYDPERCRGEMEFDTEGR